MSVDDFMGAALALFLIGAQQLAFGFGIGDDHSDGRVCRWIGAVCLVGAVASVVTATFISGGQQ